MMQLQMYLCMLPINLIRDWLRALVGHFVYNSQLCYAEEVSDRVACCACESVSIVQATLLFIQGREHRRISSMDFHKIVPVDLRSSFMVSSS